MKFVSILAAALGSATALAAPKELASGFAARKTTVVTRSGTPQTNPPKAATGHVNGAQQAVDYFTNWSGAIVEGTGLNYARGTLTVPRVQVPPGGDPNGYYSSVAWVGIDGERCSTGLIQTGVQMTIDGGVRSYSAWYEWFPALPIITIPNFPVDEGDVIRMSVWMFTPSSGQTQVENLTKNRSFQQQFSGETDLLCGQSAEWIVEDFSIGDSLAPFANFTTVTFTDAYTNQGSIQGAIEAEIVDSNGNVITHCTNNQNNQVSCTYI